MVWVRRSAWERVTERDELVGRLRVGSRFPQYLICQDQCREGRVGVGVGGGMGGKTKSTLNDSNVDRGRGTSTIDLCVAHI